MKKKLMKLLQAKEEARQALIAKSEKSEDVAELRSINTQLEVINAEITELRGMIADAEAAEKDTEEDTDERTKAVNSKQEKQEQRDFTPGKGFEKVDETTAEGRTKEEKDFADREKRGKD
jgi:hypothetical protein